MSRQIYLPSKITVTMLTKSPLVESPEVKEQNIYLEKIVKLIPADIVAVYLFFKGFIETSSPDYWYLLGWFVIVLIISPFYIKKVANVIDWKQNLVMVIAFIVWAFSLGRPFSDFIPNAVLISSILVGAFTLIIPTIYKGVSKPV